MSQYVGGIAHLGFRLARNKSLLFYDDCLVIAYTSSWWTVPIRVFRYTLFAPILAGGVGRSIAERELRQMRELGRLGPQGVLERRPDATVIQLSDVDHAQLDLQGRRRCVLTLHHGDGGTETLWWYTAPRQRDTLIAIVRRSLQDRLELVGGPTAG